MGVTSFDITENLSIVGNLPLLYIKDINALVAADLHLGVEAVMLNDGSFAPHNQTDYVVETLSFYLKKLKPKLLILNGDVKHSFQEPTKMENRDVKKFLNDICSLVPEVHIIKGNHDLFLSWAIKDIPNIKFHTSSLILENYYFTHGDKEVEQKLPESIEYIIIGHLDPVMQARLNGLQKVRSPTFLLGPLKSRNHKLLILPAFTEYSSGCPIHPNSTGHLIVPILQEDADIEDFELYVLGKEEVFHFPELKLWM